MSQNQIPTYDRLMNPLLQALRDLGGSGSTDEIYQRVSENLKLPEEVLSVLHDPETSNQTEVYYRLAWARTYLKKYGVLTNSKRGIWALAKPDVTTVDPNDVKKVTIVSYAGRSDYIRKLKAEGLKWPEALEKVRAQYPSSSPANCKKVWDKPEKSTTLEVEINQNTPQDIPEADAPEE